MKIDPQKASGSFTGKDNKETKERKAKARDQFSAENAGGHLCKHEAGAALIHRRGARTESAALPANAAAAGPVTPAPHGASEGFHGTRHTCLLHGRG